MIRKIILTILAVVGIPTLAILADPNNPVSLKSTTVVQGLREMMADDGKISTLILSNDASPTNGQVLKWNTGDTVTWEDDAGGAGGDSITVNTVAVVDPDFTSTGDIDFVDTSNTITANINANKITEAMLNAIDAPADNEVLAYNAAGGNFSWEPDAGGAETNSLETTITGILDTEFLIGTGTDTANYVALSGDVTSTNAGVVTVVDDSHNHVIANIDAMTSAALAGQISDETGSGLAVFATSPTLTTPTLGVATATTINKVTLTAPATAATITATDGTTTTLSGGTHSGTNTGDNTVATSGDSATSFFSSGVLEVGIGGTGATTLNDLIALTTHTTGNYVASITNGAGITGGDGGSEGAALTIAATLGTAITSSEITDGEIVDADISGTAAIAASKLSGVTTPSSSDTFTNKTVDANGTGNVYTNFDEGNMLAGSDIVRSAIEFIIDGGGSAITTGIKGDIEIPFNCTIQRVTMLADQSGSIVVDIWVDTYANYPPTDADSITASAVPTITTATKSQDTTLTGWTTSLTAGSTIRYNVDSAATVTRCLISLIVEK